METSRTTGSQKQRGKPKVIRVMDKKRGGSILLRSIIFRMIFIKVGRTEVARVQMVTVWAPKNLITEEGTVPKCKEA